MLYLSLTVSQLVENGDKPVSGNDFTITLRGFEISICGVEISQVLVIQ